MSVPEHRSRRLGQILLGFAGLSVLAAAFWALFLATPPGSPGASAAAAQAETGLDPAKTGPSGLPVPRFVSLKGDITNVRRGPSSDHAVLFVYKRKGLPVEIIAESEHWRRIRDSEGAEGWVYKSLLSGKRTVLVAPGQAGSFFNLKKTAQAGAPDVARLAAGVVADVEKCSGAWCEISASGYDGYIEQNLLFGVYPGEQFDQ